MTVSPGRNNHAATGHYTPDTVAWTNSNSATRVESYALQKPPPQRIVLICTSLCKMHLVSYRISVLVDLVDAFLHTTSTCLVMHSIDPDHERNP